MSSNIDFLRNQINRLYGRQIPAEIFEDEPKLEKLLDIIKKSTKSS